MTPYKNISGSSNVESYCYTSSSIIVKFKDQIHYEYSTRKNTQSAIDKMINLAITGSGLNSMLSTRPYCPYDKKWI